MYLIVYKYLRYVYYEIQNPNLKETIKTMKIVLDKSKNVCYYILYSILVVLFSFCIVSILQSLLLKVITKQLLRCLYLCSTIGQRELLSPSQCFEHIFHRLPSTGQPCLVTLQSSLDFSMQILPPFLKSMSAL